MHIEQLADFMKVRVSTSLAEGENPFSLETKGMFLFKGSIVNESKYKLLIIELTLDSFHESYSEDDGWLYLNFIFFDPTTNL